MNNLFHSIATLVLATVTSISLAISPKSINANKLENLSATNSQNQIVNSASPLPSPLQSVEPLASPNLPKFFNVQAAIDNGYNFQEIAQYLTQNKELVPTNVPVPNNLDDPNVQTFIKVARKEGYSNDQIYLAINITNESAIRSPKFSPESSSDSSQDLGYSDSQNQSHHLRSSLDLIPSPTPTQAPIAGKGSYYQDSLGTNYYGDDGTMGHSYSDSLGSHYFDNKGYSSNTYYDSLGSHTYDNQGNQLNGYSDSLGTNYYGSDGYSGHAYSDSLGTHYTDNAGNSLNCYTNSLGTNCY